MSAIAHVNLGEISVVELSKLLRESVDHPHPQRLSLLQALAVTYGLKEAYRLGEIRGRIVVQENRGK